VLHDGLKATKTLVDARTELEYVSRSVYLDYPPVSSNRISVERSNALATVLPGETPKCRIAGLKLRIRMDGMTIGVELQGLAPVAPVGIAVQLRITLAEERADGVKVMVCVAGGPS